MVFLERLLNETGADWKPLGEVAEYSQTRVDAAELDATTFVGVDNLLPDKGGRTDATYFPNTARLTAFQPGDVLLGNIRPYLRKVWRATSSGGCSGDVLVVRVRETWKPTIDSKFLYYLLSADGFFSYNMQHAKGAKMPRGDKAAILNYEIPIPCPDNPEKSLATQAEIVRILDRFTELTTELTAELTARKKQYGHYRDQLLRFEDGDAEWVPLGKIGEPRMCKRILKNQTLPAGDVPFFKIGTFGKEPDSFISKDIFEDYKSRYHYPKIGEVLLSASGTIGRSVIFDGEMAYFQDSNIVWIENDERLVLNKYLYYFYQIIRWHVADGGVIKRLYNDNIRKSEILVPCPNDPEKSLVEQARIVAILDRFDTLIMSTIQGLPREIELRQKQTEYYRDLLLSFPKSETQAETVS